MLFMLVRENWNKCFRSLWCSWSQEEQLSWIEKYFSSFAFVELLHEKYLPVRKERKLFIMHLKKKQSQTLFLNRQGKIRILGKHWKIWEFYHNTYYLLVLILLSDCIDSYFSPFYILIFYCCLKVRDLLSVECWMLNVE